MVHTRQNHGVCSKQTTVTIEGGIIQGVEVEGGCDGNLRGICSILVGEKPEHVIERFDGICCGSKKSSCPDQIAACLTEALSEH